jgi:hypothetical protein
MKRAACLALCLILAACGDEAAPAAKQGGAASGEVLAGSISDAMIPLDQLESEAPLAPRQAAAANDLDAQQPEVTPAPGINDPVSAPAAAPADEAAPVPAE